MKLLNLNNVLDWNKEADLIDKNGIKYNCISSNVNLYQKQDGTKTHIKKDEIYIAKLDNNKNKNGTWLQDNDDNIDHIISHEEEAKNTQIQYLGIFVVVKKNQERWWWCEKYNHKKQNKKEIKCWEVVCNHVFCFDNIVNCITSPIFNGCPLCKAGSEYTNKVENFMEQVKIWVGYDFDDLFHDRLMNAAQDGDLERINYLVERRQVDKNEIKNKKEQMTLANALVCASAHAHLDVIQYFIQHNVDINSKNDYGDTPLIIASEYGHTYIVKWLIQNKANINIINCCGCTALTRALLANHSQIVKYLKNCDD